MNSFSIKSTCVDLGTQALDHVVQAFSCDYVVARIPLDPYRKWVGLTSTAVADCCATRTLSHPR